MYSFDHSNNQAENPQDDGTENYFQEHVIIDNEDGPIDK